MGKIHRAKKDVQFEKERRLLSAVYEKERRNKKMRKRKDMQLGKRSALHVDMGLDEEARTMASAAYRTNRMEEEKQLQWLVL